MELRTTGHTPQLAICEQGTELLANVARSLPIAQVIAHGHDPLRVLQAGGTAATVLLIDIHAVPASEWPQVVQAAGARPIIWVVPAHTVTQADTRPPAVRHVLPEDFSSTELKDLLSRLTWPHPHARQGAAAGANPLITHSEVMRNLIAEADLFADCSHSVLIRGDTGTGKERIAQRLHRGHSRYGRGPFVPVNCGAIPDGLFESHFFGHARGAFTGALHVHKGYFEQADGGTLFLDEVGDLPLLQQVKLLRVLESSVITRLGTEAPVSVDFRLVAATNRNLQERVASGEFRSDLYYRLAVIELQLPTLEERGVIDKVAIFRAVTDEVLGAPLKARLGDPPSWLIEAVAGMHFPGNVRQLRSLSERLGVIARQTGRWDQPLCERALHSAGNLAPAPALPAAPARRPPDAHERQRLIDALEAHEWRRQETARQLGISRKALWERMRKYQIQATGEKHA